MIRTERLDHSTDSVLRAGEVLRKGGLVALPTETVYGLGADARNGEAVARIYDVKGRPSFNPLIVHVARAEIGHLVEVTPLARDLMAAFWPGPLTLVLKLAPGHGLSSLVTAGLDTVALRMPDAELARAIIEAGGGAIAAPSANPSGALSPTTADHVLNGLDGKIDAVVDGGPCVVGLESTIVNATGQVPVVLRPGGIPIEAIPHATHAEGGPITAPGQLSSHYAPKAAIRLNATDAHPGEVLLGFGDIAGTETLSASGDLREAAARLFELLHRLDGQTEAIAVAPIPDRGLGRAINDRLTRAAAPRHSK